MQDTRHLYSRFGIPLRAFGQLSSARGMAAVPPFGYQMPSLVCMFAIAQRIAGELSGAEPTYCTKCSSIWRTRPSWTQLAIVPETVCPRRMAWTSLRSERLKADLGSKVSRMESERAPEEPAIGDVVQLGGKLLEALILRSGTGTKAVERYGHGLTSCCRSRRLPSSKNNATADRGVGGRPSRRDFRQLRQRYDEGRRA